MDFDSNFTNISTLFDPSEDPFFPNATCHPDVHAYRYFGASLGILVTLVGTVGNVLTLLSFAAEPRLRTRFNALILNLTASDLLYCAFLQPVTSTTFIRNGWRSGPGACRLTGLLIFVANAVSIFNLILIAGSRYALIANPRAYDRIFQQRTMPFFVVLPWALGLALFGPLWPIYVFLPTVCTCSFHRQRGKPYTTVLMFFMFVVGLGCIGVFYYLIDRRVKAASRALELHRRGRGEAAGKGRPQASAELSSSCPGPDGRQGEAGDDRPQAPPGTGVPAPAPPPSPQPPGRKARTKSGPQAPPSLGPDSGYADEASRATEGTSVGDEESFPGPGREAEAGGGKKGGKEAARPGPGCAARGGSTEFHKVTRMCFAMFLVYIICYMPFCILHVLDSKKRFPVLLHMVAGNFSWLNSSINPILYAVMNRQFREAYQKVLLKAFGLCRRH
ncbi:G-protein coupled receptor 84 [Stegostoma tigrinum]|uniref:G-protein coupled receptor 84 n=1 Tax=Stegostoma tigrinum TaxID=3053191 RepID=UPI00202B6DE1|nr:G-protein coupled receptor 84 [Stegostoma tigrinum]